MPCRALVRISQDEHATVEGRIRDISSSGAFIETMAGIPVYARIALWVLGNESAAHAVEIPATVVRADRDGIGVEWCETPASEICGVVGCTTHCEDSENYNFRCWTADPLWVLSWGACVNEYLNA